MSSLCIDNNAYVLTIFGQHALLFAKFSLPTGSNQRLAKCCHLKSRRQRLYWSLFEVPGVFQAVLKIGQTCSLIIDGLRYALWIDKSFSCSIFYKRHLLVSVYRCTLHHTWHLQSTACNYRLVKSCQVRWCHAFSIDQYPVFWKNCIEYPKCSELQLELQVQTICVVTEVSTLFHNSG